MVPPSSDNEWLTIPEAAKRWGISREAVRKWITGDRAVNLSGVFEQRAGPRGSRTG